MNVGRAMTEEELLQSVLDYVQRIPRLLAYHARPARVGKGGRERWVTAMSGNKGFPDLVITGPNGVLYRELKTMKGRVSVEQHEWLNTLTEAGADAKVWRPDDWPLTIIQEIGEIR